MTTTSAPPYGPAPEPRRRRRGGLVGPLVLIFLGGVFLLQNAGYLPPNFWFNLWRLWPVVLVLIGIELLLAGRIPWLVLVGLGAAVLVCGAVVTTATTPHASTAPPVTRDASTELGAATQAIVAVRYGAGELVIGPLADDAGQTQLAKMTYEGPPDLAVTPRYSVSRGIGQLEYQLTGHGATWPLPGNGRDAAMRLKLDLSPAVPITRLTVQSGGTDARLDLASLRVNNVDVSIGAATATIRMPYPSGTTTAHITGGAATINIEIPKDVPAQIRKPGGLNTINIDASRFPQVTQNLYKSLDYDNASDKIDMSVETGLATIQVD